MKAAPRPPARTPRPVPAMTPEVPLAMALREALLTALHLARASAESSTRDSDPIHLHDYRVAIRIQRSLLAAFQSAVPPKRYDVLRSSLRALVNETGPLRDLDVLLQARPQLERLVPPRFRAVLLPLFGHLEIERDQARSALVQRFGTPRHRLALDALQTQFRELRPRSAASRIPAGRAVASALRTRRLKLEKHARRARKDASDHATHALRIEGKRLRYLVEFFQQALPSAHLPSLLRRLKATQDVLGNDHDSACQYAALLQAAETFQGNPTVLQAILRLLTALGRSQKAQKKGVRAAANALLGKRVQRWLDELGAP